MTGLPENPHALALLARMATVTFGTPPASLKVGDAVAPKSGDGQVVAPSAVLFGREGGSLIGSLGCIDTDGELPFQVTSIGRTASEARAVSDKVRVALTGAELLVLYRWIPWVRRRNGGSRVERDDDLSPPLFYVVTQYVLLSISAS